MGEGLTQRQLRFIAEYVKTPNGKQAAIEAGYSASTADVQASRLLANVKVRSEVDKRLKAQADRLEISADVIKRELLRIATVDIGQAFDESGLKKLADMPEDVRRAISGIEVEEIFVGYGEEKTKIGQIRKLKFWDKVKSLELLGKHLKLFTDVVEHQGKLTLEELVMESETIEPDDSKA